MSYTLSEIVTCLGGELRGADCRIVRLAPLSSAREGELCFFANSKYRKYLNNTAASAVIVSRQCAAELTPSYSLILADDPYLYFAQVATLFHPAPAISGGIHPSVVIGEGSTIAASAEIHAHVSIGRHVSIGEHCQIFPGVVIGNNVSIGESVTLYPNVTVYCGCQLGNRTVVHAGTVIGSDGFGIAWAKDHWFKVPQTGRVVIGDDVEIGANTAIDRGALADTIISNGVKIDNLVQIAHNVCVGQHTAIAGCVGIAGSTHVGAYCLIGGAAMLAGHLEIADNTRIGGGAGVSKSILAPGHYAASYPLSTWKEWRANAVHVRHLNDVVKRLKNLEHELGAMKDRKDDYE